MLALQLALHSITSGELLFKFRAFLSVNQSIVLSRRRMLFLQFPVEVEEKEEKEEEEGARGAIFSLRVSCSTAAAAADGIIVFPSSFSLRPHLLLLPPPLNRDTFSTSTDFHTHKG